MIRFKRQFILLLSAALTSVSLSSVSYADWTSNFARTVDYVSRNTTELRTDWPREVADAPVVSVYKGTPENNVEGQFDMAGAIKAFEFAQLHRFPFDSSSNPFPLKAYVWDDTLAEFAKKLLLDEVTLGKYDKGYVFDNTGRFDQSSVYCFDKYFLGTTGYPYDIESTITAKGKTIDEAIMVSVDEDSFRNPLVQRNCVKHVGAAVLNHNGEKLLLFVTSEEGMTDIWDYINDHGGVDKVIYDLSMPIETFHSIHPN